MKPKRIASPPREAHDVPPALGATPLPGAVMPQKEEEKLLRDAHKKAANDSTSKQSHYSDDDDHAQTIPI